MVRTSTAERYNYRCPVCGDDLKQDISGRGYVAHVSNRYCRFEQGERDYPKSVSIVDNVSSSSAKDHGYSDGIQVFGYSERGIINSLLYEIGYSRDPIAVLAGLLSLISIPGQKTDFSGLQGAEILIEQSLSDFGDADAIFLLHGTGWRCAIFMEGKVKPSQTGYWTIDATWREFLARKDGKLDSSNLFTQLYHKVRFVSALRQGGIAQVANGVQFPACSTKELRRLGSNPVVRRAAQKIEGYTADIFYVAVIPDSVENLSTFFHTTLKRNDPQDMFGWSIDGWGFLTWEQVETFCLNHGLTNTRRVFEYNRGQIY